MSTAPIAVIGATGTVGRRIVERLTALGHPARPLSRRTEPRFDWDDESTWQPALDGCPVVYVSYYPDLASPEAPARIATLTSLAEDLGVRRLVLLSGRGEAGAGRCEDIVRESRIDHTLVRAGWFTQNFTEGQLHPAVLDGVLALPAGDVVEPFVDADDIADVAVAALTQPGHTGREYEVTGPRLLSFASVADEIATLTGHPLDYVPIDTETFRAALTEQVGPDRADLFTGLCAEVFDGRNATLGTGVQDALGRVPRDLVDVCRDAVLAGAWAR
jgi:uncharacterized protein YbjT (DUF2867 family)